MAVFYTTPLRCKRCSVSLILRPTGFCCMACGLPHPEIDSLVGPGKNPSESVAVVAPAKPAEPPLKPQTQIGSVVLNDDGDIRPTSPMADTRPAKKKR